MDDAVIKILSISAILGLLLFGGFSLMDNSMNTIRLAADQVPYASKIKREDIVKISDDSLDLEGGDVIAAIRYYSDDPNISVSVTARGTTRTYTNTQYKASDFGLSELAFYEASFSFSRSENGKNIYFIMK